MADCMKKGTEALTANSMELLVQSSAQGLLNPAPVHELVECCVEGCLIPLQWNWWLSEPSQTS